MTQLQLVVPAGIDDPARPSGGNVYDRRIAAGLRDLGWAVREHHAVGAWPHPLPGERAVLADALARLPEGSVVLIDGLIGSAVPDVLLPEASRLRLVLLVHMPLDTPQEHAALSAARAIVVTSGWTRDRLLGHEPAMSDRVRVARPGVDPARPSPGSQSGGQLLCVGAATRIKGQDVLLEALTATADQPWSCACVGALDVEPGFAALLRRRCDDAGLGDRVTFPGALGDAELDRAYAHADLLVQPSRAETYGMVVTEALARGVPVLAADVGGVSEALGRAADGSLPGMLVPPEDPRGLAEALSRWLADPAWRQQLQVAATSRRDSLRGWDETSRVLDSVLSEVADD